MFSELPVEDIKDKNGVDKINAFVADLFMKDL